MRIHTQIEIEFFKWLTKALKEFWKELWCRHEWESPNWDWKCKKCGKIKSGVYR